MNIGCFVLQGSGSQSHGYTSSLEEENEHLQASIERLGNQITILEKEKEELANDAAIAKATVSVHAPPSSPTHSSPTIVNSPTHHYRNSHVF